MEIHQKMVEKWWKGDENKTGFINVRFLSVQICKSLSLDVIEFPPKQTLYILQSFVLGQWNHESWQGQNRGGVWPNWKSREVARNPGLLVGHIAIHELGPNGHQSRDARALCLDLGIIWSPWYISTLMTQRLSILTSQRRCAGGRGGGIVTLADNHPRPPRSRHRRLVDHLWFQKVVAGRRPRGRYSIVQTRAGHTGLSNHMYSGYVGKYKVNGGMLLDSVMVFKVCPFLFQYHRYDWYAKFKRTGRGENWPWYRWLYMYSIFSKIRMAALLWSFEFEMGRMIVK